MSALSQPSSSPARALPDYLPARMINEFAYCPRLFYYEQVEGVFVHNEHTVEGAAQHKRVDKEGKSAPAPGDESEEPVIARSIMLSSEPHRVLAKLDLAEFAEGAAVPVDYKHGRPMKGDDGPEAWPSDIVQMGVQALVLRANGYRCDEGVVFYQKTRQRVRIVFDEATIGKAEQAIAGAWATAAAPEIPPPLVDSPKCPGCSLVGVCLPDETTWLREQGDGEAAEQLALFEGDAPRIPKKGPGRETRLLVAARVDARPLYLNTHGLSVGKSGGVLRVKDRDKVLQDVRIGDVCQVNLMGNVQISTQAVQELCERETPICYFSKGGWFYGVTAGMSTKNVFLRRAQYRLAEQPWFCLRLARRLTAGKIQNQRTMLMRNHIEPSRLDVDALKRLMARAEEAASLDELLGVEGAAASVFFGAFSGMLKRDGEWDGDPALAFDFRVRNRRPPRDPVNALLSLAYSLLAKDLTVACYAVGLDPMMGYYHQPRHGRPALALDLMEPLRPLIADSAVLSAVNTRMISERDFVRAGQAVSLTANGRKAFFRAYEQRMDTLVTHPLFDYRVSYRRLLEIQARVLAKTLEGELGEYAVFVTR
ncbi:MAG: CRISPR-associated endonuclease Cas1 [Acidobacteria bacterium]|nr:CRISPR-associated endonuclease Cas1 [Acidobacteriota bacterium]